MSEHVHITKPISFTEIIKILEDNNDLKTLTCSKSVYNRISKKYLEALDEMGIKVEIKYKSGAKKKYAKEEKEVLNLALQGKKPKEISEILKISTKTVYYLLSKHTNKIKLDNYKRKYDLNERNEIISLFYDGLSANEIANRKNIPISSIYYILANEK